VEYIKKQCFNYLMHVYYGTKIKVVGSCLGFEKDESCMLEAVSVRKDHTEGRGLGDESSH
jgi:hypothetical protein